MKRHLLPFAISILLLLSVSNVRAGQLSPNLAETISAKSPTDTVSVWITIKPTLDNNTFKAAVMAQSASRAEQHRFAVTQLRAANLPAQQNLIGHLDSLRTTGKAGNVKGHWIANVVEAQVAVSELNSLALRSDVESVDLAPRLELIAPIEPSPAEVLNPTAGYIPNHLKQIRADSAWKLGYTGAGRLICSFDNGVDGNHVSIKTKWRGYNGDSASCWFDPVFHQKSPHTVSSAISYVGHGTHVMGIAVGKSDSVTTGVAYDAKWISAAVVDIAGASFLDAFEWACDPDGDPNTADDVPDVINHSWGLAPSGNGAYYMDCRSVFYTAIENSEALGIVNIFAAGNTGSVMSIFNPANGDKDSLYCFAVGSLDTFNVAPHRAYFSSQGPSDCLGGHKPNVVARGSNVYSCIPGTNTYGSLSGTSMSAPEVSGLVAMLRQKNPNATVNQIKLAILNSTNRTIIPGPYPNDSLGWGEIDCVAALNALSGTSAQPNVRLYDFTHLPVAPGDTVHGTMVLQNLGATATNVSAAISGSNPSLVVLNGSASFGTINSRDTVRSANIFRVVVSDTVTTGSVLTIPLTITGTGFSVPASLAFIVGPPTSKSFVNHVGPRLDFTVSNFGVLGMGSTSIFPAGGLGFNIDNIGNDLYEAGLMVSTTSSKVSSGVHSLLNEPDIDFVVAPGGNITYSAPGALAPQQTYAVFADDNAAIPIGVNITQESFAYNSPDDNYIILKYTLRNKSASSISGLRLGLFLDWDIVNGNLNAGGYDASDSLLWEAYNAGTSEIPQLRNFRGVTILEGLLATAYTQSARVVYNPWIIPGVADGYTTMEKWQSMIAGLGPGSNPTIYQDSLTDLFTLMAAGPFTLAPGATTRVAFAILGDSTLAKAQVAVANARAKYQGIVTDVTEPGGPNLPGGFALYQNYPNPFNPTTRIAFSLSHESDYTLSIFNVVGQEVERMTGRARAGRVELDWDASHRPTGVYLYRVTAGDWTESRKMLLLK
jgi:subtilisin family serine protease